MKYLMMLTLTGTLMLGCSDDDDKTPGTNCTALKACCATLPSAVKSTCESSVTSALNNETVCKTSLDQLMKQGYCKGTTDAGAQDTGAGDASTGDTSTGDTSTGDTSTGDTSTADTSTAG